MNPNFIIDNSLNASNIEDKDEQAQAEIDPPVQALCFHMIDKGIVYRIV